MPIIFGKAASSAMPSKVSEASNIVLQTDEYGAMGVRDEDRIWSEQGSYFKATNPAMGTGVPMGVQASFSDTSNILFLMRNGSPSRKIIPHYFKLICTAPGTAATSSHVAVVMDTVNRYSTGGTDLLGTIQNASSAQTVTSIVDVLRYNCTGLAPVSRRVLGRSAIKTGVAPAWVAGDEFKLCFSTDADAGVLSGTGANRYVSNVGVVVLSGLNHCLMVHLWNPAGTAAPSFEFECAWWER